GGAAEQRRGQREGECVGRLQVDQELEFGGLINRNVTRLGTFENVVHVIGHALEQLREIKGITHQRTAFDVIAIRTDRRQSFLHRELGDELAVGVKVSLPPDQYGVPALLRDRIEHALNLSGFALLREDKDERNSQFGGGVPQDLPNSTFPSAPHSQKYRLGHRRNGFFQYLQPLPPDLDPGIERDAGEVAAGAVEVADQSRLLRIEHECNKRYWGGVCRFAKDPRLGCIGMDNTYCY